MFRFVSFVFIIVAQFLGLCNTAPQHERISSKATTLCGGTMESDNNTLEFLSESGDLESGLVCVWTLHLNTFRDFTFNFQEFDLDSDYADCRDSGLRIYALTNLAPVNEAQSYTFCNGKLPPSNIFLGYNVAVIVLYTSSTNSNPGRGFRVHWEGSSLDSLRTRHVSSYTNAYEGAIQYPIVGNYPINTVATWLIKPLQSQLPSRSDLIFNNIDLETCAPPSQPCTCDAIIIYNIASNGLLNETARICRNGEGSSFYDMQPRFLVAFFTDFETVGSGAGGFQAVYFPTSVATQGPTTAIPATSTTERQTTREEWTTEGYTTQEWTTEEYYTTQERTTEDYTTQEWTTEEWTTEEWTTEEWTAEPTYEWTTEEWTAEPTYEWTTEEWETTASPISRVCGDILTNYYGEIAYKPNEIYQANERCVWTLRSSSSAAITLTLGSNGLATGDHVHVSTFRRTSTPLVGSHVLIPNTPITLNGSVAIVTFASDGGLQGEGFYLEYYFSGSNSNITSSSRDYSVGGRTTTGRMNHPASGSYANNELSTGLVSPFNYLQGPNVRAAYTLRGQEGCNDLVFVHFFSAIDGWFQVDRLCSTTTSKIFNHGEPILFVFTSDASVVGSGFYVDWTHG